MSPWSVPRGLSSILTSPVVFRFSNEMYGQLPSEVSGKSFYKPCSEGLSSILVIVFVRVCTDHGQVKLTNSSAGR